MKGKFPRLYKTRQGKFYFKFDGHKIFIKNLTKNDILKFYNKLVRTKKKKRAKKKRQRITKRQIQEVGRHAPVQPWSSGIVPAAHDEEVKKQNQENRLRHVEGEVKPEQIAQRLGYDPEALEDIGERVNTLADTALRELQEEAQQPRVLPQSATSAQPGSFSQPVSTPSMSLSSRFFHTTKPTIAQPPVSLSSSVTQPVQPSPSTPTRSRQIPGTLTPEDISRRQRQYNESIERERRERRIPTFDPTRPFTAAQRERQAESDEALADEHRQAREDLEREAIEHERDFPGSISQRPPLVIPPQSIPVASAIQPPPISFTPPKREAPSELKLRARLIQLQLLGSTKDPNKSDNRQYGKKLLYKLLSTENQVPFTVSKEHIINLLMKQEGIDRQVENELAAEAQKKDEARKTRSDEVAGIRDRLRREQQYGTGNETSDKPMFDDQINSIMCKYPDYMGTIANDDIKTILPKIKPQSRLAFIINTDKHNSAGAHWQSVYIDARPGGSQSIEFVDTFGRDPSPEVMRDLRLVVDMLRPETYLKLKINRVVEQYDNTNTCGWHAIQFLIDRFRGKTFAEATGYNPEKKIHGEEEKFEDRVNKLKWSYI